MLTHDLAVGIHAGAGLADKDAVLLEFEKGLTGFCVDSRRVGINVIIQVDLGPIHMEKVERVVFGQLMGLLTIDDIVRDGSDGGGETRGGNETGKRADAHGVIRESGAGQSLFFRSGRRELRVAVEFHFGFLIGGREVCGQCSGGRTMSRGGPLGAALHDFIKAAAEHGVVGMAHGIVENASFAISDGQHHGLCVVGLLGNGRSKNRDVFSGSAEAVVEFILAVHPNER